MARGRGPTTGDGAITDAGAAVRTVVVTARKDPEIRFRSRQSWGQETPLLPARP